MRRLFRPLGVIIDTSQVKSSDWAVLLHLTKWPGGNKPYRITDHISLQRCKNSKVERLYHRLCQEAGLDNGDPFEFDTYLHFESVKYTDLPPIPHSLIDQVINLFVIASRKPLDYCRMILSRDNFSSSYFTCDPYRISEEIDFVNFDSLKLDSIVINDISIMAKNLGIQDDLGQVISRINTTLTYYYYAWRSQYLDQFIINLTICLEYLFAPEGRTELSHQIAVNTARFLQYVDPDLDKNYRQVKKLYSARSALIHGSEISDQQKYSIIGPSFSMISSILKLLLKSKTLLDTFGNEKKRKALIRTYIFGKKYT